MQNEIDKIFIDALKPIIKQKAAKKGEIIFLEGDTAEAFYVLNEGQVDLIKSSPDGKERLIRKVLPGEIFAEAVVFSGEQYPVTAISKLDSKLSRITKDNFLKLIKKQPEVSLKMMGTMSKLLRHLNQLISDLTLDSVESRLIRFLLEKANSSANLIIQLDLKKSELAYQIGTSAETLSRTLKTLKNQGLISVKGKEIKVCDADLLKKRLKLT